MAPRSAQLRPATREKLSRSKSDLYYRGRKQGIRDMMAKVTGSRVIEMTFFGEEPTAAVNKNEGHQLGGSSNNGNNKNDLEERQRLEEIYQAKRFPLLGPTRQDTELFFSMSRRQTVSPGHESTGERKRVQPSPSPGWQDQPPSRAPSRSSLYPTNATDVTRIDIFPDCNGDPATRCSEQKSATPSLSAKPPRSTFIRSVDQGSRNSSAQKKHPRSTSSSAAVQLSRSADCRSGNRQTGSSGNSNNRFGDVEVEDDNNDYGDDDGDGGSGVYCVIRSGVTPRARPGRQFPGAALTKHQFRQVCSRPHQAVVFTADTASLLLQSGPPLLIRPATDVYLRSTARSAIQRVTDVNYLTELHGVPRSKSGVESGSRRGQDLVKGHLALGRSSSLKSSDLNQSQPDVHLSKSSAAPVNTLQRAASDDTICRNSSAGVKKKRLDTQQVPYISRDSSAASRHNQRPELSGQPQSRSEASNSATALNMASRQHLKKVPLQKPRPAQQAEVPNGNQKTLSPSKHGFHPRSHSPTFKRLIAASERLQEAHPVASGSSQKAGSVSSSQVDSYNFYGSSSSDSLRDMRSFSQEILNGMLNETDNDHNNNTDKHSHNRYTKKSTNVSSPPYLRERNSRAIHKQQTVSNQGPPPPAADIGNRRERGALREARTVKKKTQCHVMQQRHDVSYDRQQQNQATADDSMSSTMAGLHKPHNRDAQANHRRSSRLPGPGGEESGEIVPPATQPLVGQHGVEMEARVRDGQPTQLHFFLPQLLADGMSEGSGGTLTGRSNYRERRLELLDRRESRGSRSGGSDGGLHHDSSAAGPGRPGYLQLDDSEDLDPTTITTITEIPNNKTINSKEPPVRSKNLHHHNSRSEHHSSIRDPPHRTNGHRGGSKERITAYDLKHGHLALNRGRQSPPQARDDGIGAPHSQKHKRQISPLRTAQKPVERPARNRRASNSPFRAPVYLESQLPSEKLKKQIEDFPTLVSMDYSDTDTSLQVR